MSESTGHGVQGLPLVPQGLAVAFRRAEEGQQWGTAGGGHGLHHERVSRSSLQILLLVYGGNGFAYSVIWVGGRVSIDPGVIFVIWGGEICDLELAAWKIGQTLAPMDRIKSRQEKNALHLFFSLRFGFRVLLFLLRSRALLGVSLNSFADPFDAELLLTIWMASL